MPDSCPVAVEVGKFQSIFPCTLEELIRKKYNICSFLLKAGYLVKMLNPLFS